MFSHKFGKKTELKVSEYFHENIGDEFQIFKDSIGKPSKLRIIKS